MAEFTRPATWEDLKTLARYLLEAGAEYALIGGYAIAAHGYNRFSEDVDILVNPSPENSKRWIAALARLPDAASRELEGEADVFADGTGTIRINDEYTIDVMPAACGRSWSELERYVEEIIVDEVPIKVLGLEGLLLTKEGKRDRDRADAQVLREALAALKARKR